MHRKEQPLSREILVTGFLVTMMWLDKENIDKDKVLQAAPVCSGNETGMAQQSCCPQAVSAPDGVPLHSVFIRAMKKITYMPSRQKGLTLIEMMVAMAISLVIVIAAAYVYLGSRESQRAIDRSSNSQETGAFVLQMIGREDERRVLSCHCCPYSGGSNPARNV